MCKSYIAQLSLYLVQKKGGACKIIENKIVMNNKYVGWLLTIMFILIGMGIYMAYFQNLFGFVLVLLGGLMSLGFKSLKPSPREVGIITFFGVKKPIIVEGLTLVLNWPFDIVDVVVIVVQEKNIDYKGDKAIRFVCKDYVSLAGNLSITVGPDYTDDPAGTIGWMSGGQKIIRFDDSGGWDGITDQLREIMRDHLATIASGKRYFEMQQGVSEITLNLRSRLTTRTINGSNSVGTTLTMGIKIINVQCNFESSKKLEAAGESGAIEDREKDRDEVDTTTFTKQVEMVLRQCYEENARRKLAGQTEKPIPSIEEVWGIVDKMRTLNADRRQVIQSSGGVLNVNDINEGKKGKK